jgi:hypothetical protein
MEINDLFVQEHIRNWINAWNDHDLKKILSFNSEDILFSSPKVNMVFPDRQSATIVNKRELEGYFSHGLKKFPNLHFTPLDYFLKDDKVTLEYLGTPDNKIQWSVMEKFEFNTRGLIAKSNVYYGVEAQIP